MSTAPCSNGWAAAPLADEGLFTFENGIWTGKKPPFVKCLVIRNFRVDPIVKILMANSQSPSEVTS
jgi:hypothetical protein